MQRKLLVSLCLVGLSLMVRGQNPPAANAPAKTYFSIPSQVVIPYQSGQTNYEVIFTITNSTPVPKRLVGHYATCGCTDVRVQRQDYQPGETGKVRLSVTVNHPTIKGVIFADEAQKYYQTLIKVETPAGPVSSNAFRTNAAARPPINTTTPNNVKRNP